MTSEIRLVVMVPIPHELIIDDYLTQTAIPWCTTHDSSMTTDGQRCLVQTIFDYAEGCVISTGGPDHKWWKDTE